MNKLLTLTCCFLLITSVCFADSIRKRAIFMPPLEGLNTSVSPLILNPKSIISATNVLYDQVGSRKKRGGLLYLNETSGTETSGSNTVMGIFDFKKIDSLGGETRKILTHLDGKIFKIDSFDGTLDNISNRQLSIDKPADYAVLRKADTTTDSVIMVNGSEIPQVWDQDSTTVSDLTGGPTDIDFYPSCIETHNFRLWAAGVPSYPYRVFFSAGFKHDDWNTAEDAGYIDVIDSIGSRVTGLAGNYYSYIVVFLEESIHIISGSTYTDYAVSPIITNMGAVNNAGIVPFGNDIFFVSSKGIHSLSTTQKYGDILETYLSAPIQESFNSLNKNRLKYCYGAVYPEKNYLIWSFTDGGQNTNDTCFVYDYIGKRWSKWTGINASSFAVVNNNSNSLELVAGNYDGFINRMNRRDYNDNGQAYTMSFQTPYISFDDSIISKSFKEFFIFLNPQGSSNMTVSYTIDNEDSELLTFSQEGFSGTLDSFILDVDTLDSGTLVPLSNNLTGTGKTIQLTFEQGDVDVGCEVYGYGLEFLVSDINYSN